MRLTLEEIRHAHNVAALATEFVTTLRSELDYQNEARNLTLFREAFADDPGVAFPAPIDELTSSRVLTMEYSVEA